MLPAAGRYGPGQNVPFSRRIDDDAARKLELLSRAGYVAKGIVYATVGVLVLGALYGAFGNEGLTGTRGAVNTIAAQPLGNLLIGLLIIGLLGYVFWRFAQGIRDTESKGGGLAGWVQRTGFVVSGVFYASLAWYAVRLTGWFANSDAPSASSESTQQALAERLMSYEAGIWAVGVAGLLFIGVSVYQFYRAASRKFEKNWCKHEMSPDQVKWAGRTARIGISARAITFVITGGLLLKASMQADPDQAKGLGYALQTLRDEPYGTTRLTVIGAGLVCYGLYCIINARYRTVAIH